MKIDLVPRTCKECGAPFKVLKGSKQRYHNFLCFETGSLKRRKKGKKRLRQSEQELAIEDSGNEHD